MSIRLQKLLGKLPERWQWTCHNLLAHPLSEILYQIGKEDLGNKIHDATVPDHVKGQGRG